MPTEVVSVFGILQADSYSYFILRFTQYKVQHPFIVDGYHENNNDGGDVIGMKDKVVGKV